MVDLAAVNLISGVASLHEVFMRGQGVRIGVVDAQVRDPLNESFVAETFTIRPRRRGGAGARTHGDDMLDLLRQTAPEARAILAEVAESDGLVYRRSVAAGIEALEGRDIDVALVSLEFKRLPERCSTANPCEACTAAKRWAESVIVVVAAGNRGEVGYTCPAAEAGQALVVVASEGPRDSDAHLDEGQSGTSVSAALTAGGIALLRGAFPDLEQDELKTALFATATGSGVSRLRFFHFFRAYRYLQLTRAGGSADEHAAQTLMDAHSSAIADAQAGATDGSEALAVLEQALLIAPWSAQLNGCRAALLSSYSPDEGLAGISEAIRLEWDLPWLHRELARQLDARGLVGAAVVEREIAEHLDADELGRAHRALMAGLAAQPPLTPPVGTEPAQV